MTPVPDERAHSPRAMVRAVPLSLVVALASLFFFGWVAEEVLEQNTRQFDDAVRGYVHRFATPARTEFMRHATWLGSGAVLGGALVIIAVLFLTRERRLAGLMTVAMLGAGILDQALKASFKRARPQPFFDIPPLHSYAFPSGHALVSFCFYSMVGWMITRRLRERWQRIAVWAAAGAVIALVGLSRIYLGVHYPSDVIAGYAGAAVWMSSVELVGSTLYPVPRKT
jgi:undecaprenyl-diphosphatase